jgi:flagellar biosynthetic protein FliP
VALLRVADRVLLVSVGEGGTTLITELTGDDACKALELPEQTVSGRTAKWLRLPRLGWIGLVVLLALAPSVAQAQTSQAAPTIGPLPGPTVVGPGPPQISLDIGDGESELKLSGAVGIVVFMGALTLLPALLLLTTSFTRILVTLHFLRSALGTQTTPPGQLLVAIAVLLTAVVMAPVLDDANRTALAPYFRGEITQVEAYQRGFVPFRGFMLANTREQDLAAMSDLSRVEPVDSIEDLPTAVVVSAFVVSELRTAFQIGFLIYVPFIVVDLIVASVLMSMGMFMLPPIMVSLPFKLLLFVLADGWSLVVQNVVAGFRV